MAVIHELQQRREALVDAPGTIADQGQLVTGLGGVAVACRDRVKHLFRRPKVAGLRGHLTTQENSVRICRAV